MYECSFAIAFSLMRFDRGAALIGFVRWQSRRPIQHKLLSKSLLICP